MFYFFDSRQRPDNASYYKGVLFEKLTRDFLAAQGYGSLTLRAKDAGLEIDLTGKAEVGGYSLVGEANAHTKSIPSDVVAAFVTKLLLARSDDPHAVGLLVSTSPLTPEAEATAKAVRERTAFAIEVLGGEKLFASIRSRLSMPDNSATHAIISRCGTRPLATSLLTTEHDYFLIVLCSTLAGATPSSFAVVNRSCEIVADNAFLERIRQSIPDLAELSPIAGRSDSEVIAPTRSSIPEGLVLGTDWADYRLPARPEFFVGRRSVAAELAEQLFAADGPRVVQLKSRSGVGKSSFVAFLREMLLADGAWAQVYDARDIKSTLDLLSVVQSFTGAPQLATDSSIASDQLSAPCVKGKAHILFIDQFESVFSNRELFESYELVASAVVRIAGSVRLVVARKNDLLTTYDDSQISLDRLNSMSRSVVLEDFTVEEAVELIKRISTQTDKAVSPEVKTYVLEFARGFPWLIKRTMAHVVKLLNRGESQAEVFPAALRLNDLFDEELEVLDEVDKDYLVRIAQRLPATYQQLDRSFEDDPNLRKVLDKLTRERLLRLSGSTYDTYNDVFKEYLVYHKLPEFRVSFLYRLRPGAVLTSFRTASTLRRFTTEQLTVALGRATGTTFNVLRELRNVGLIDRREQQWFVSEAATEAHGREQLGEYIRQQLLKNGLVTDLLAMLSGRPDATVLTVTELIKDKFAFVDASEKTWNSYAASALAWLGTVRLVRVDRRRNVRLVREDRATVAREIGNLKLKSVSPRSTRAYFLPGAYWTHVVQLVEALPTVGRKGLSIKQADALRSLIELGLATADGKLLVKGDLDLRTAVLKVLTGEPYNLYWSNVSNVPARRAVLVDVFQLHGLESGTISWRDRLLSNWGKALGITAGRRRRPRPAMTGTLF